MEMHIGKILENHKPQTIKVFGRRDWIYSFMNLINSERYEQDRFDIKTFARILQRWATWELPVLYKECDTSNHFGKHFWWAFKQKPPYVKPKKPKQLTIKL